MTKKNILLSRDQQVDQLARNTTIEGFITEISADLGDLEQFYNISFSETRHRRCEQYCSLKLRELERLPFHGLDQGGQVDWLLAQNFLRRRLNQIQDQKNRLAQLDDFLHPWTEPLIELCEWRQHVTRFSGEEAGRRMHDANGTIQNIIGKLNEEADPLSSAVRRQAGTRAVRAINELRDRLSESVKFYRGYDPNMTWWMAQPWEVLSASLAELVKAIEQQIIGGDGSSGDIVGQPLGREALSREIDAEYLPYAPEELIKIGEQELAWCEKEMRVATRELGFDDPRQVIEHVKNTYVAPGEQVHLVHSLAKEAVTYIQERRMITIPPIADECWQTHMMSPAMQLIAPYFLGGTEILVAYPTDGMSHADKLMSMRGNSPAFSRSTVFHELIPGHHLQYHYMARYRTHRRMFDTPFWMEGWSVYWEMVLWERGFASTVSQGYAPKAAENKIGMLFWRMHRCARIIFSIKFHLGQMTPQQCIDLLVEKVGHERAAAEAEVRRSLNGDYSPLYQAGYMLGALQLMKLRHEVVESGPHSWTEQQFHDWIMRENNMPIELLRALLENTPLSPSYRSSWHFYTFAE